jgi:hypothetical protein
MRAMRLRTRWVKAMADLSDMFDDPKPLDENDPEAPEEMLELHKYRKMKPEDLLGTTPEYREQYAE